jgi:hypothetical protein
MGKYKIIKLDILETRFLLNFVLEENNIYSLAEAPVYAPCDLNINNCKGSKEVYLKKIRILKRKLEKLDNSFYGQNKAVGKNKRGIKIGI